MSESKWTMFLNPYGGWMNLPRAQMTSVTPTLMTYLFKLVDSESEAKWPLQLQDALMSLA